MAYLSMPLPEVFKQAIRASSTIWYSIDATYNGSPVLTDLRPIGGSITDTTKPGIRRTLTVDLAGGQDLFNALSPIGTRLTVTAHVRLTNRTVVDVPMGVFDLDSESLSADDGRVSLTAPDLWVKVQRAKFIGPASSYKNVSVQTQLVNMFKDVLGQSATVNVLCTRNATMKPTVWEKDRDKAMIDLAQTIGAWCYFDRLGVATIADIPTEGPSADWLVDASATGVLTELDRERSRSETYNVVVVTSSATDGEKFPFQVVADSNPSSPTYAGTDPWRAIGTGPFGVVPYYYDTPILATAAQARDAGKTILARVTGLVSSVSLGQVPNPAVDAFDTIDVLPPNPGLTVIDHYDANGRPVLQRLARGAVIERHVVDTVTHPLVMGTAQQIEGRSTQFQDVTRGATGGAAAPSYAGTRTNPFDPATSLYNITSTSMSGLRSALGQRSTARVRIALLGHSEIAGQGATPGSSDVAVKLRDALGTAGWPVRTGMVRTWINTTPDNRFTFSTGWALGSFTAPFITANTSGRTITFTQTLPGTSVDVLYYDNSVAFTVAIDGGAATTVTPGATNAVKIRSFTGLANTTHTVVITSGAGNTYIGGVGTRTTPDVEVSNHGIVSSLASHWLPDYNGASSWFNPFHTLIDGLNPHVVGVQLDANEALTGVSVATYKANMQTLLSALGRPFFLIASPRSQEGYNGLSTTTWNTFLSAQYDLADQYDVPLLDVSNLFGTWVTANDTGWMSDQVHPNAAGYQQVANKLATLLTT